MHGKVSLFLLLAALATPSTRVAGALPARVNVVGSGMADLPVREQVVAPAVVTNPDTKVAAASEADTKVAAASGADTEATPSADADNEEGDETTMTAAVDTEVTSATRLDANTSLAGNPAEAEVTSATRLDANTSLAGNPAEDIVAGPGEPPMEAPIPIKTPEEAAAENAKTMAHLKAQDNDAFEKCVHDAGYNVISREDSLVQDIVDHSERFMNNYNSTIANEATSLAHKIDQAKVIADCRASAIGGAIAGQISNLTAKINADKAEETAISCKKDIHEYIEEQTKSLFDGEIERMELLKSSKTAVQLASAALFKNTAQAEARVMLVKLTLINVQQQTALLKATKEFLRSARAALNDPELIANENMMCEVKNKIKAEILAVEDFATAVEKGKASSAEALRVSNCIKKKTAISEGEEGANTFLEISTALRKTNPAATATLDEKPCILADALATLPSRQGQPVLQANAQPEDPLADSIEGTESMETLIQTEINNLDETLENALDNIKQAVHDHIEASSVAGGGREDISATSDSSDDAVSLLQFASAQQCLKARAHAAHTIFKIAKSKTTSSMNNDGKAAYPLLSLIETNVALKEHLATTSPCADHVYDLLLEMEVQAGHRAATKTGAQAWALRARAAARAGQQMQWKSDMYENNPKKIDCDTAYKCKEKIEEKRKKDAQPKKSGFLSGIVNAVAGGLLGNTCVVCPDQLFLPAIKAYKMDEFTEKGPLGRSDAMERVQYRFVDPEDWDGKSGKHTFGEPDKVGNPNSDPPAPAQPCLPAIDDEFVMPCCKPKVNPITDGLIIAGRPPFAMDDQIGQGAADDFIQVMERKLRGRRNRGKKTGGFVGALGAVAAGAGAAAGMSIPYIPGSPSIKWNSENTFLGMNCCGGGPACCRWCPEQLCEPLEMSSEKLEPLWWAVCSETDVSGNPSTRR